MFYLRVAAAVLAFVAASFYGIAIALVRRDRTTVASDYAAVFGSWMRPLLGIDLRVLDEHNLDDHRPCVFVGNHQSMLDVAIYARCFKRGSVVIAKKEVGSVPFFGWIYRRSGNLLIDRSHTASAVGQLKAAEAEMIRRKAAIWILPEGTRGGVPGKLLPFKKGAFQMALHTGVPIIPVVVSPLKPGLDLSARRLTRTRVDARALDPIPTAGLTEDDLPMLMERTRRVMAEELHRMAVERGIFPPDSSPEIVLLPSKAR